ncbi:MAG: radical SAM protein [Nanoarchaeota archaeon]|nr:radical SAM protein [Nanoarchaeota archaeon]
MKKIEKLFTGRKKLSKSKPISFMYNDLEKIAEFYFNEKKPGYMALWFGRACNLGCGYCATDSIYIKDLKKSKINKNDLKPKQVKNLIRQFADLGGKIININGRGEPLLDQNLFDYINLMNYYKINIIITTNGTLINKDVAKFFYDNKVAVNIKLHALDEKIHNKLVGADKLGINAFKETYNGLKNLIDAGYSEMIEENNRSVVTPISIQTLILKDGIQYIPDILNFDRENNFYPALDDLVIAGRANSKYWHNQIISKKENKNIAEQFKRIMGYKAEQAAMDQCPMSFGVFFDSTGRLLVDKTYFCCDGLCINSEYKFPEQSLSDIWKGLFQARQDKKTKFDERALKLVKEYNDGEHIPMCYGMAKTRIDHQS